MAKTIVRICGVSGERTFYGYEVDAGGALGRTNEVTEGIASTDSLKEIKIAGEPYCRVHNEAHPSKEITVQIPFVKDDFNDPQGDFNPNWVIRFNKLASEKVDHILFQASQTG